MKLSISKNPRRPIAQANRQVRARASVLEVLGNNFTGQSYMATVSVGTPPQDVALAIDTGSSDTWVLSTKTDLCVDKQYQAEEETGCQTPYNPDDSSTYRLAVKNGFHITYGDGSGVDGDYFTDDFTIGDVSIKGLQMGIAQNANLTQGLLGIGYTLNEASNYDDPFTIKDEAFVYPNIIDAMVSQKLISTNAYSLYLDDLDSSSGSIIFGGLDADKFQGQLIEMPVVPRRLPNGTTVYAELGVAMTSFAVSDSVAKTSDTLTTSSFEESVILDSGTALTYLPEVLATAIYTKLNAYDDSWCIYYGCSGLIYADCDIIENSPGLTLDFKFGNSSIIRVPAREMILIPEKLGIDLTGYIPSDISFSNVCILGVMSASEEPYILGETFLRSAYVVYDLKNHLIALAQTNFDSTTSSIIDFEATQTAIPLISGVASVPPITETGTGRPGGKTTTVRSVTSARTRTTSLSTGTATQGPFVTQISSGAVSNTLALDLIELLYVASSTIFALLGGGWLLM
ncbi:aspartic peptidase domain-containing protein [Bisporella sp. PMI_857]|nr:aspartic peptidase domain-containing protein [Bisporella sp. PMI_857]